jgi:hypothetical protein
MLKVQAIFHDGSVSLEFMTESAEEAEEMRAQWLGFDRAAEVRTWTNRGGLRCEPAGVVLKLRIGVSVLASFRTISSLDAVRFAGACTVSEICCESTYDSAVDLFASLRGCKVCLLCDRARTNKW